MALFDPVASLSLVAPTVATRSISFESARGMGVHQTLYASVPLEVRDPEGGPNPDFVGFYRRHVPDPIMFARDLRVTIQQIGCAEPQPAPGSTWRRRSSTPAGSVDLTV
jgi:Protein of unknown function (DUF2961)